MAKFVGGVLMLVFGAVLACWVAFNLLVARQAHFQMSLGAFLFMSGLFYVGTKWAREGWPEVQGTVRPKPQKKKRRRPVAVRGGD